jgi:dipeptidyl aminopeptidase/acylaminoacyl peptidase
MTASTDQTLFTYLNATGALQPNAIPGKPGVTFLSKKTGLPQVWKWDAESREIYQLTQLEDRVMEIHHSPSGKKGIIGMDRQGNEKQQFYIMDMESLETEELVISPDHFHYFGGWSPDEQKIAFSSNRRHPGFFDVYVLDVADGTKKPVFKTDGNCTPICWLKDGSGLIVSIPETNIDQSYYVLDLEGGIPVKIGAEQQLARHGSIQLLKDGSGGYLVSDSGRDTLSVRRFRFDSINGLPQVLEGGQWDIDSVQLSPDNSKLAYTVNEGGISRLEIYEVGSNNSYPIEEMPVGVFDSLSWINEEELVVGVKSPILPGDVWKVSLEGRRVERLTFVGEEKEVEHPWVTPELCTFSSFDGLEVPYFLYGKKDYIQPVVIYVHGGPEYQIRAEFNPVIQYLAANGFAVAAPNVRGSMGYGREYVKLDDVRKRMDSVADLKELAEDLITNHGVNRERIGIMGRSYGGFMVLAAMTHYPDVWAAGVDIVGISHFKSFLENTGPWRRALREFEYGSLKEDSDFFEEIAPLNHTEKIVAPLLVFHGRNDTRVPVNEAEQLTADLQRQGKQVDLVIFEDEGHQTEKMENHISMNTLIAEFMQTHLKS